MTVVETLRKLPGSWRFFLSMVLLELVIGLWFRSVFLVGLKALLSMLVKIAPVLFLVFLLMAVMNYFLTPKIIASHLGGQGVRKWLIAVIGGMLSVGPVYLWYPILADLKKQGLSGGWIACFLYSRAIKVPLLPLATYYFGWQYVVILTVVMVLASIVQAQIINYFDNDIKYEDSHSG